jgi:AraC-like DNA-binding protein
MSAPQRLTDEQIRFARMVVKERREALRRARMYPTLEELADALGCTPRYLTEVVNGRARQAS